MIITEETKEGRNKQLIEFINHPLIQRKCTFVGILGISMQQLNGWMNRGIRQTALELINNNKELLQVLEQNYLDKEWHKEKAAQKRTAKSFTRKMDLSDLSETSGLTYHGLAMSRSRGKISLSMARIIADKTNITMEEMRPDIPALAIKYGVQRW